MIYQNNLKGNPIINTGKTVQDGSEIFLARRELFFSNVKGETFTIEKNTLFSVNADSFPATGEYEINIKCFGISPTVAESIGNVKNVHPLAMQNAVFQKMTKYEYDKMIYDFDMNTFRMSKSLLEDSLLHDSRLIQYCSRMTTLMQEHIKTEKEAEEIYQLMESDNLGTAERKIKTFFDDIKENFEKTEENPLISVLTKYAAATVFGGFVCGTLVYMGSSTTVKSYFVLCVCVIVMLLSILTALLKPSGTAEFLRDLLLVPMSIIRRNFSSGSDRLNYLNQEYDNIKQLLNSNEARQSELRKQLRADFPEMIRRIMSGKLLPGNETMVSVAYTGLNFSGLNAADISETETRTDEEIRGGCERVVYPVYKTADTPSDSASVSEASSGRHVISLSKTGKTASEVPERKKVDLTKH